MIRFNKNINLNLKYFSCDLGLRAIHQTRPMFVGGFWMGLKVKYSNSSHEILP